MRVLLTEGSGLTSRQVAGRLSAMGHHVGVLSCDALGLARFTRATRAWHDAPAFGAKPLEWLDVALDTYRRSQYDVLFPTQEQVTILAAFPARLHAAGVATAVPDFAALRSVQDKLSAHRTLARLGLPQPEATIAGDAGALHGWQRFPIYVKTPIGTATSGVHHVTNAEQLRALLASGALDEAFIDSGVLVQEPVDGPLVMVQAVFEEGHLIAFHANLRVRLGARGGASHKRSICLPEGRAVLDTLGAELGWHGALSADIVVSPAGPQIIDINPRLVEPANALQSGTDLTAALLDVALGHATRTLPDGRAGVATHQLLLAILGAAEQGRGRRGAAAELRDGVRHRGEYGNSAEELTPGRHDLRALAPVVAAAVATLARPSTWQRFTSGSVANYALTATAWREISQSALVNRA